MFLCVVLACANLPENSRRPSNRNTATGSPGTAGNSTNTATSWDYSQFEDEMGRGTVYMATIESRNTINLDFPYSGDSTDR